MAERLSLADLERFDPSAPVGGRERLFYCPLLTYADKPVDRDHRSLSVKVENGVWCCHRYSGSGILLEFRDRRSAWRPCSAAAL
jgi:hypothetical protein